MEWETQSLLETFNYLLEKLNLQQDIWGYIAILFILSSLAFLKLFILVCLAKHFKNCNKSNFEVEEFEI